VQIVAREVFNNALAIALAPVVRRIDETTRAIEQRAQEYETRHSIPRALTICVVREFIHTRAVAALDALPHAVALILTARRESRRYIVWDETHALTCLDCAKTTHNPNDARFRFCPVHKFLDDPLPETEPPTGRAA
jgi:hypothetical protein